MRANVRAALIRLAQKRGVTAGDTAGWRKITIRDVIDEANISIGTFYRYFDDRADLAQTLWVEPVNNLRATIKAACDAAKSPEEKVRSLLSNYSKFALENRQFFRTIFLFVRPDQNQKPDPIPLRDEPFYALLKATLESGQKSGDFREFDSHEMAQTFWAAIHGSLALPENFDRYQFDQTEALSATMIDRLVEMVLKDRPR